MNFQRRLRKLNQSFVQFGVNPYGDLIYQWMHTTDLHYLLQRGDRVGEWRANPDGLLLRSWEPVYERHTWADTPHGQKWIMAKWQAPVSKEEWERTLGTSFPWPSRGEYHPIENMGAHDGGCTCKNPNEPPDEAHTVSAVAALKYHLGKSKQELIDRMLIRKQLADQAVINRIGDDLDDTMTAFGRVPGSNDGSTSLLNEASRKAEKNGLAVQL